MSRDIEDECRFVRLDDDKEVEITAWDAVQLFARGDISIERAEERVKDICFALVHARDRGETVSSWDFHLEATVVVRISIRQSQETTHRHTLGKTTHNKERQR
jgi:hypothetical protein